MFKRLLKRFCKWLYQYFPEETYSIDSLMPKRDFDKSIVELIKETTAQTPTDDKTSA